MFENWPFFSKPHDRASDTDLCSEIGHGEGAQQSGLVASTMVATARGWQRAEDIKPGDQILTFDAGLQTVTQISRETPWTGEGNCPQSLWPLEVPKGAFGNSRPFLLLGNQNIMVESDAAEDMFGDPFSVIPASALQGLRGIERVPPRDGMEIIHVYFAEEQVVFGEYGALYLCPSSRDIMDMAYARAHDPLYSILPLAEARIVASSLREDMASVSGEAPQFVQEAAYA